MRASPSIGFLASLLAATACAPDDDGAASNAPPPETEGGFLVGEDGELPDESMGLDPDNGAPSCLGETRQAESIGLDMFVMLDISGSMLDALPGAQLLGPTQTKWDAVRESLEAFVRAPETADIGIGLQYFPQGNTGVPLSCSTNDECGAGGPCTNTLCVSEGEREFPGLDVPPVTFVRAAGDVTVFCGADTDCAGNGESCRTMVGECVFPPGVLAEQPNGAFLNVAPDDNPGVISPLCETQADCLGLPGTFCEEIGVCTQRLVKCSPSIDCPAGAGACAPFPFSCENQTSCDVQRYSAPAVAISAAANRGDELIGSLRAQIPQGLTPTGPALSGALEQAQAWAQANPGRQVVTVLATDGFPTVCEPLEIPDIAAVAGAATGGERPVRTFVIGVFGGADLGLDGQQRLDEIARAGGTDSAIVINTAGDVAQDFLAALEGIRNQAVSCEFLIDGAGGLDFDRVNLQLTDAAGASSSLLNVGDSTACGNDDGWYYVRDAAGTPLTINVCPNTCATFMGEGVSADLQIGCATRIR